MTDFVSLLVTLIAAGGVALWMCRRGPDGPPGFVSLPRWTTALVLMILVLWIGVFLPATTSDLASDVVPEDLDRGQLATTPTMLLGTALLWAMLAYGVGLARPGEGVLDALGLRTARPVRELVIGAVVGVGIWAVVVGFMLALGVVLMAIGDGAVPESAQQPAPLVVWLAGLPLAWRVGLSLAAGISEEIFFRGMLQKRVGIVVSTVLFVLGHMVYGAPLMLIGITLLSLIYGVLARVRGNVVSAIAAHVVFDAIQLLVVIPATLGALDSVPTGDPVGAPEAGPDGGAPAVALLASLLRAIWYAGS